MNFLIKCLVAVLFGIVFAASFSVMAQEPADPKAGLDQVGAFYGRVLPKDVSQEDEIFPMWGVRYSYHLASSTYIDGGFLSGEGSGTSWQGLFGSVGIHIPVETLVGHAGVGLDATRYSTSTTPATEALGLHFVGGMMARIGGNCLARFDMKLTSKPGTTLFFGLGIVFELGGSANGT